MASYQRISSTSRRAACWSFVRKVDANRKPSQRADYEAHHRLAQRVARESIVLLKNEGGVLPIRPSTKEVCWWQARWRCRR